MVSRLLGPLQRGTGIELEIVRLEFDAGTTHIALLCPWGKTLIANMIVNSRFLVPKLGNALLRPRERLITPSLPYRSQAAIYCGDPGLTKGS